MDGLARAAEAGERTAQITEWPERRAWRARAEPKPEEAPVMNQTRGAGGVDMMGVVGCLVDVCWSRG